MIKSSGGVKRDGERECIAVTGALIAREHKNSKFHKAKSGTNKFQMGDRGAHQRETNTPTDACSTARIIDAIMRLAAWHGGCQAVYAAGAIVVMQAAAPLRNFPNVFLAAASARNLGIPSESRGRGDLFEADSSLVLYF